MSLTSGIDFGTTNSSIGYNNGKQAELISLQKNGSTTDRTSIFYSFDDNGLPIIGEEGYEACIEGDRGRLITSPKSFLKTDNLPTTQILREKYDLLDIISHIISDFKEKLEEQAGKNIDSILVGRPVHFDDNSTDKDKRAQNRLEEAFKRAGFKNIEFQYEPIGALNSYLDQHPELKNKNEKILVVDLGGGTSDFSVIDIQNGNISILGNAGTYTGGDDFDKSMTRNYLAQFFGKGGKKKLMNCGTTDIPNYLYIDFADKSKLTFLREYIDIIRDIIPLVKGEKYKIGLKRLEEAFQDWTIGYGYHRNLEQTKKDLTNSKQSIFDGNMFKNSFEVILERQLFESIVSEQVENIRQALLETLKVAGVEVGEINHVVMNGGTSYIPIVRKMVEEIMGKGKILEGNTLSSVGYGLTLESYERFR